MPIKTTKLTTQRHNNLEETQNKETYKMPKTATKRQGECKEVKQAYKKTQTTAMRHKMATNIPTKVFTMTVIKRDTKQSNKEAQNVVRSLLSFYISVPRSLLPHKLCIVSLPMTHTVQETE